MALHMKDYGKIATPKDKVNSFSKMETSMMENGEMESVMVLVPIRISIMPNLKVIG